MKTKVKTHDEIRVCSDCRMAIAYGDVSGAVEGWDEDRLWAYLEGLAMAGVRAVNGSSEDTAHGDSDHRGISHRKCDGCGVRDEGDRYAVTLLCSHRHCLD